MNSFLWLVAMVLSALAPGVQACTVTPDFTPLTFDLGEIVVDPDKPEGSLLKATWIDTDTTSLVTCSLPIIQRTSAPATFTQPYVSGGLTYYQTSVDGVAVGFTGYQQYRSGGAAQEFELPSEEAALPVTGPFYMTGGLIMLIKSRAHPKSGAINGQIATVTYDEAGAPEPVSRPVWVQAVIRASPCEVLNESMVVDLHEAYLSEFSGAGSVANPVDFSVMLNCSSGTPVNIQLDAPGAQSDGRVIPEKGPGAARGIDIQLLDALAQPVTFATPLKSGTTGSDGEFRIPFTARYYHTGGVVGAGKINATVNFTLTYD